MTDKFGSPEAGDATAEVEQMVNEVVEEGVDFVLKDGPEVANRTFGTKAVDEESQFQDWLARPPDFSYWASGFESLKNQKGAAKAALELMRHDKKMRERARKQARNA